MLALVKEKHNSLSRQGLDLYSISILLRLFTLHRSGYLAEGAYAMFLIPERLDSIDGVDNALQ